MFNALRYPLVGMLLIGFLSGCAQKLPDDSLSSVDVGMIGGIVPTSSVPNTKSIFFTQSETDVTTSTVSSVEEEGQIIPENHLGTIVPDAKGRTCLPWGPVCFVVPAEYVTYEFSSGQFVMITAETDEDMFWGDSGMTYMTVSVDYPGYDMLTAKSELEGGYYRGDMEVVVPGVEVRIGGHVYYKVVLSGLGGSRYDFYFIEQNGLLYQFKSGYQDGGTMVEMLKTVEFNEV